ncbi:MAG: hypothetical protein N2745_00420 [Syntrophorhabdaceae bacterium]|nr:hypothetical protein [Syntrophorhabdaceae bacterium]
MYSLLKDIPSDFPLVKRPYEELAKKAGLDEKTLIEELKRLKAEGVIRRIAAILYHRQAKYTHNAMVVWKVKEEDVDKVGPIMASFPEVSHCYEREKGGYWDYNLYTMIHGKSQKECEEIVKNISEKVGIFDYRIFISKREFKKIGLRYIEE